MPMLRNFVTPLLRETVRSMLLETGPSAVTVSFAEGDDATTALFSADPAAGTLALVNALDAADFAFNASTGVLTWAITPDYETQIAHSVDISTTDGDGEVTLQRVTVRITPVSEFSPSFGATPTTVSVAEDVSAATFFTPSVTDADAGETITFALSGTHAALFTINAATGALRFTSAADFENGQGAGAGGNVYDVTMTASDGTQSTAHSLQITVTDVADEAPVFTSATTASTPENNTGVFYTAAASGDAGSAVTFAIQGGYGYASAFSINGTSGAVSFEAPGADFEVLASYTLPIVATDAAGNAATLSLAITVTDVDEIAPVFTSAAAVSVAENILGTVYTAVATDASAVTYSLAAGVQDNDLFAIDGASGAVTFNSSPDFEAPADADTDNVYDLTITATDGSANVATLGVAITVTDVVAESSVPTAYLDLDFVSNSYRLADAASSFADALTGSSPKLTYATTSNSTMTNSSGEIVWAPHNLLDYSEDFSQSSWELSALDPFGSGSALDVGVTEAPDGTNTADFIRPTTANVGHYIRDSFAGAVSGSGYTMSVYVKDGGYSSIGLRFLGTDAPNVTYDLSAVTASDPAGTIESVGNGWYRCSLTGEATGTLVYHYVYPKQTLKYVGDGTSGIYVWGAHLYRSDLGGMAPVPGAATGFEYYVPTNGAAEYLPRVGHHVYDTTTSTWVNEGLLLESEQRTNLRTYSTVPDSANAYRVNATSTSSSETAPDGSTDAVLLTATGSGVDNAWDNYNNTYGLYDETVQTYSFWVKAEDATSVTLGLLGKSVTYTFATDSITTPTNATGHVEHYANGWVRLGCTATQTNEYHYWQVKLDGVDDTTKTAHIWGVQLEIASIPSSYIPTSGSTVTRAAQTLTVPPAELGWDTSGLSLAVEGRVTASDAAGGQPMISQWKSANTIRIDTNLRWNGSYQGNVQIKAYNGPSPYSAFEGVGSHSVSEGVLSPYSIAWRHTSSTLQAASSGSAISIAGTPNNNVPDLSAADMTIGTDFMGTISHFRQWDEDIGETGIEEASS